VHVLVEQRQAEEVQCVVAFRCGGEQRQRFGQARGQIGARRSKVRQIELPTRRVCDPARVIQRVGLRQAAGGTWVIGVAVDAVRTLAVAGKPVVLEPADVPDFPERRIELRRTGNRQ
jgi:hypothetical protein